MSDVMNVSQVAAEVFSCSRSSSIPTSPRRLSDLRLSLPKYPRVRPDGSVKQEAARGASHS